ncbi:MAG: hypothetical protein ACFFEY_17690 [Candidatus Thorarchaeota archaeon]
MRKRLFVIVIILGFINVACFSTLLLLTTAGPSYNFDYEPINFGPELRKNELSINFNSLQPSSELLRTADPGDFKYWLIYDYWYGQPYLFPFLLMAQGDIAEVWVQVDLSWPSGDPRTNPIITQDQVDYFLNEFENTIYPNEIDCFGMPDYHDGSDSFLIDLGWFPPDYYEDSMGRTVILVSNIRDENYYDPRHKDYAEGFYSSDFEFYFDRNVISIDSYDWENRIGPNVAKPYFYEGVLAYEYQHLIHDDYFVESIQPDEPWMNEGCSMFAEILCGYPPDWNAINSFFATPDNSLIEWEDQGTRNILADYGQAFLWVTYLFDNYEGILKDYFANHVPGIEGLNEIFPENTDFDEVFRKWRIDNLLKRNYDSLDLHDPAVNDIRVYDWTGESKGTDFGNTITILGWDTGISKLGTYGTDYFKFSGFNEEVKFSFDGQDDIPVPGWIVDTETWGFETFYPPAGDLDDLVHTATVQGGGVLTFDTFYYIEDYWDFGFVQVSTDGGNTWTSLENAYTTYDHDPTALGAIINNLPGFTGCSGDWIDDMAFDLSAYTGEILIGFRYMTDWSTVDPGWWVKDVKVDGTPVTNFFTESLETNFTVDFVIFKENEGEFEVENIIELQLDDLTEVGTKWLDLDDDEFCIVIVSINTGLGDYEFSIIEEDDDQDPPILTIEGVNCFSDEEPGVWRIVAEDESGLYEIGLNIDGVDYLFTQTDFGTGSFVELLIPINNELGEHTCEGYAIDADLDLGSIDQLETVHPTVSCYINDDDTALPIIDFNIIEKYWVNDLIYLKFSVTATDDTGIGSITIQLGDEKWGSLGVCDAYYQPGFYNLYVSATDTDNDRPNDALTATLEQVVDLDPPETDILIDDPKILIEGITYITPDTPITLISDDSMAVTWYSIQGETVWLEYSGPYITLRNLGLNDGEYTLEYHSIDIYSNIEQVKSVNIALDDSGPELSVLNPPAGDAIQDGVTLIFQAMDLTGVDEVVFSIREPGGTSGIIIGPEFENIPAVKVSNDHWQYILDTLLLPDGYYIIFVESTDLFGFCTTDCVPFSIRNWAILELLPATESNTPGRTMPVKFSLRVHEAVDPEMPFVRNEELTIMIYAQGNPSPLQISIFGENSEDYRISSVQYVTNFKTDKNPTVYVVEIWRKDFLVGSFTFETVDKKDSTNEGSNTLWVNKVNPIETPAVLNVATLIFYLLAIISIIGLAWMLRFNKNCTLCLL